MLEKYQVRERMRARVALRRDEDGEDGERRRRRKKVKKRDRE